MRRTILKSLLASVMLCLGAPILAASPALPGKGMKVLPVKSSIAEESFQTLLVVQALKDLGYDVQPMKDIEYAAGHVAIANGDATFMATHWNPLHKEFYEKAGGDAKLYREGSFSAGALQGYLIDKASATRYGITSIAQLKDPKIAALFDTDGDGKADLAGCNPGWGCELAIEHHLDAYGLRDTVTHRQGTYAAIIADTIARYRQGKPILYYTWTPYWVSGVLQPGKDTVWLQVPFSAVKDQPDTDTALPDGKNYGFVANRQQIVANRAWAEANPAAARLFAVMTLPNADINAQNMRMRQGEDKPADINRHVSGWIRAHRQTYDGWLAQARAATRH